MPERPAGRVTDLANTLSRDEMASLDRQLAAFERGTTDQIAVLIIPSLEGDSLEDYSIRLAEKWKIGQKGRSNGVILLIVKNDRKLRIEVGYGLEGALPDALAGTIIRSEIAPRFRAGQFYQGIEAGIQAIMAATKGEYKAPKKQARGPHVPSLVFFSTPYPDFRNFWGHEFYRAEKTLSFRRFPGLDFGRGILRGRIPGRRFLG